jgi:hypothetical protein
MPIIKVLLTFALTLLVVGVGVFGIVALAQWFVDLSRMARKYREWEEVIKQIEEGSSEY